MPRFAPSTAAAFSLLLISTSPLPAQRGGQDWTTAGNDAQRSNWLRADGKISPDTMAKPGFELLWKVKMNNVARANTSVTPPALLDFYIGYRGFRTLGFFGGSGDTAIGIDTDLSRVEWEKKIGPGTAQGAGSPQCPGGMTSAVTRVTPLGMPGAAGFGRGRGNPAKSGVGEPGEGAVTLKEVRTPQNFGPPPGANAPANNTKGGRRQPSAAGASPFGRSPQFVYAVSSDGKLHAMYVSNGEEANAPIDFLPPNAHARGLIVFDSVAFVATVNGCGGVEDGIWSVDLASKKVLQWKGKVTGALGYAVGPDGMLYVASGSEIVAIDSESMTRKASYKSGGAAFTSSPLVFDHKGKPAVAATTADGKLHIVEASGMVMVGTGDAGVGDYAVGALASWQETGGTRWFLAPTTGKVVAVKLADNGGVVSVQSGWVSRDLVSPIAPAVVNGVVFAVSAGRRGTPAVLYALNGATGKEMWSSGKAMASFVTSGGLAAGGGRVYVSTHDGTQYAFGMPMEH